MTGYEYATEYVIPNFYFHVSTAYNILRANGIEIGKTDYLGGDVGDDRGEEAGADLDGVPAVGVAGAKGGEYPVAGHAAERGVGVSGEFGHADGGHARAAVAGEAGKSGEVGGNGKGERVSVEYDGVVGEED